VAERLKTVGYVTGMCGKVGASPCDATPTPIPAALRPLSLKLCWLHGDDAVASGYQ
jgi:hypothetical protein